MEIGSWAINGGSVALLLDPPYNPLSFDESINCIKKIIMKQNLLIKYLNIKIIIVLSIFLNICLGQAFCAETAPGFWISSLEGKRFDSRKHQGDIIISFFEVNCLPCKKEIPQLYKLVTGKKLNAALLYIDPSEIDSKEDIRKLANRLGVPREYFYHDAIGRLSQKFFKGQFIFPTIVYIKNRQILFRTHELDEKSVTKILDLAR